MPAFTFEKISPPVASVPTPPAEKKPRGVIVQLLDRLAEGRSKRIPKNERSASKRTKPKS
jgi:hypothetical protein